MAASAHLQSNYGNMESLSLSNSHKMSASLAALSPATAGKDDIYSLSTSRRLSKSTSAESLTSVRSSVSDGTTSDSGGKVESLTPDEAVRLFGGKLNAYELNEIYNYKQIYFVGQNAKKRNVTYNHMVGSASSSSSSTNNFGFDDENGSYILVPHDHIAYRYEILKIIGKGSFGQVIKAYDHRTQQYVALKLVRNEKRFHRQVEEEIRILDHLRKQDKDNASNIIHMLDHFSFRSHKCISFELLSINLYELIKKNKFQGFSISLVRKFAYSILQCLNMLYRNRLIHCDLKPGKSCCL